MNLNGLYGKKKLIWLHFISFVSFALKNKSFVSFVVKKVCLVNRLFGYLVIGEKSFK
jgi:hypothetical protein